MSVIDFRSDFLSRPTARMQTAMRDVLGAGSGFAFGELAEEKALEDIAATVLGKQRALFCVTCSQATQIAINVRTRPGDAVITEETSHIVTSEAGTAAAFSGVMIHGLPGERGAIDPDRVAAALSGGDPQRSRTSVVVLENTHVRTGGSVVSLDNMIAVAEVARAGRAHVHLDGSRIFNAATYLGVSAAEVAACADSVSISLNKGLAAPQGAILAGSDAFIEDALRVRQLFGGGWRPAPALCAAGLVALETMPPQMADDHRNAARLAAGLAALPGLSVAPETPQTNLVLVDLTDPSLTVEALAGKLESEGVRVLPFGARRIRLALYHDITADLVDLAIARVRSIIT